jgi:hypothetical protein
LIITSGGCANLGAVSPCTDTGLTNGSPSSTSSARSARRRPRATK